MKKSLKITIIVVAVVAILLALVFGGYFIALNNVKKNALSTVDSVFTALKTGDSEQIKKYVSVYEDEENGSDEETTENDESREFDNETIITMLKNLDYEVLDTKVDLSGATLTLNVSNKNIRTVLSNYITKLFSLAFSNALGKITEEEMTSQALEYLKGECDSDEIETVTTTIEVSVYKDGSKWVLDYDSDELFNAVLPGYKEAVSYLNSITSEEEE